MTIDPNNRPGGPHLVVTCKTANKVQFFDAATLERTGEIEMPASTHEMVLSGDGRSVYASVYGGGIFGRNTNPDRRIALVDLEAKAVARVIDAGAAVAPHGVMFDRDGVLWCTAELADAVLAIDPASGSVESIDTGKAAHWLAISHAANKVFASCKTSDFVAVIDRAARKVTGRLPIPDLAEGLCVTPDGGTVYVCAHRTPTLYVFDAASGTLRRTITIMGGEGRPNQLKRVRVSPDSRFVCVSSLLDNHVAIFAADSMKQIASIATPKAPMGFGFAPAGRHAYLCCHDDAVMLEFDMATGGILRQCATASGCEYVVAY
ncbi:MAG: beta-propeller fold lactonase family protein [Pseudorhodoplanes sp.]|uniref:YncE family protein n=1 Tax=Pseudorhodoplanes sp. TaxID=1934341 RepID=UPI003D146EFC